MAAMAASTPGAFATRRPNREAAKKLKNKLISLFERDLVELTGSSELSEFVSVQELQCPDEGCADMETFVLLFDSSGAVRFRLRIRKEVHEVREEDLKVAWSERGSADGHDVGHGADGGADARAADAGSEENPWCSCCENNEEKQRQEGGCGCCFFQLKEDGSRVNSQTGAVWVRAGNVWAPRDGGEAKEAAS
uniref:Uncharacterized protein n=1 Tax=Florenciella parvula TaxID=236787 RepID=A0A7S2FXF6_9STRA